MNLYQTIVQLFLHDLPGLFRGSDVFPLYILDLQFPHSNLENGGLRKPDLAAKTAANVYRAAPKQLEKDVPYNNKTTCIFSFYFGSELYPLRVIVFPSNMAILWFMNSTCVDWLAGSQIQLDV